MTVTRTFVSRETLTPVTAASIADARLAQQREREDAFRKTGIRLDDGGRPIFPARDCVPLASHKVAS